MKLRPRPVPTTIADSVPEETDDALAGFDGAASEAPGHERERDAGSVHREFGARLAQVVEQADAQTPAKKASPMLKPTPRPEGAVGRERGPDSVPRLKLNADKAAAPAAPAAAAAHGGSAAPTPRKPVAETNREAAAAAPNENAEPAEEPASSRSPASLALLKLPDGMLQMKDVLTLTPWFEKCIMKYADFLPLANDGKARTLSGNVFRTLAGRVTSPRFLKLAFLSPLRDAMVDIQCDGRGKVILTFNFGSDGMTVRALRCRAYLRAFHASEC
jgi:hypothetical protein